MNSIRPLVTITILVVVGAFLYVKINEGPVQVRSGDAVPLQSSEDVPPLVATTAIASQTETTAAPAWPANSSSSSVESDASTTAAVDASVAQPPAVPAIPEIPAVLPSAPQPDATAAAISQIPSTLPENIPTAQYPNESTSANAVATAHALGSDTASASASIAPTSVGPPIPEPQVPLTPEQANSADIAANSLSSTPLVAQENPLRQPGDPTSSGNLEGTATIEPGKVDTPSTVAQASFPASWPEIQVTLDRGDYAKAHQMLSRWYNDPALTPTDAELVETLLSQLAGTVVYSAEHQLEPAHVVKPGETLETIAKQYDVPWQLLAKINGIASVDQAQPGRELKVVRGPFSAVVDLGRKQLTLMVGDRYAGRFPIVVSSPTAVGEGQWLVDQKLAAPSPGVVQSAYTPVPTTVERSIILRAESNTAQPPSGGTLAIGSGPDSANVTAGGPAIRVSPQDAEELSDILSIGSRVVIQR